MTRVCIIGAGGHGRVVASMVNALTARDRAISFAGYVDNASRPPAVPAELWLGDDADLDHLAQQGRITHFVVGVGGVRGGLDLRRSLYRAAEHAGLVPLAIIHDRAVISDSVTIGGGSTVMAGAILNPGVSVGVNVIVNTGSIVDHDCCIADHAHIAPGAVLSGGVAVGENAMVGAGAVCREGLSIGAGATIGAGAVVVCDIPPGQVVKGVPAR